MPLSKAAIAFLVPLSFVAAKIASEAVNQINRHWHQLKLLFGQRQLVLM